MSPTELPAPRKTPRFQEHEVAQPERARRLFDEIPDQPETLDQLYGRHILSVRHLSRDIVLQLFRLAACYEAKESAPSAGCRGRIVISAFLDQPNNRTRLSFESAALHLGIRVMSINEHLQGTGALDVNLTELVEMFNTYGDVVTLRTRDPESFAEMLEDFRVPVINAGDGTHENPTQAVVDLYTIFKWRPDLLAETVPPEQRLRIGIFGEPWRTRTIRSLLLGLRLFPQAIDRITIFGRAAQIFAPGQREELEEAGLRIEVAAEAHPEKTLLDCLKEELPRQDVVYSHMLNPPEISRMDRLEGISLLKADAMVLHPRLRIRELSLDLDDSPHNAYFAQARGAVYVRMAVLDSVLGNPGSEGTAE